MHMMCESKIHAFSRVVAGHEATATQSCQIFPDLSFMSSIAQPFSSATGPPREAHCCSQKMNNNKKKNNNKHPYMERGNYLRDPEGGSFREDMNEEEVAGEGAGRFDIHNHLQNVSSGSRTDSSKDATTFQSVHDSVSLGGSTSTTAETTGSEISDSSSQERASLAGFASSPNRNNRRQRMSSSSLPPPLPPQLPSPTQYSRKSDRCSLSSSLHSMGERKPVPDLLTVFQAAPLAFRDERTGMAVPLPALGFEQERKVLTKAIDECNEASLSTGNSIDVDFQIATTDRLGFFLAKDEGQVMHFSCHGHPE